MAYDRVLLRLLYIYIYIYIYIEGRGNGSPELSLVPGSPSQL
jgi:hypothetical protein